MSRLQNKCFLISAGTHLLLLVILLVGPAFLSSKNKPQDPPPLDFIPSMLIEANLVGGGNRSARQAPAVKPAVPAASQASRQLPPERQREQESPKETVKTSKADPESFEVKAQPKHRTPLISTEVVNRKADSRSTPKTKPVEKDNQNEERQLADARQKAARQLATAAQNIREGTGTKIEDPGPGGGGPSYASYAAFVKARYENAWEEPSDAATDDAITKVTVTIANTGHVLSAIISRPSGDSPVDRSVQRTLERVTFIAPFPDGVKDKQRTYIINFNLKAKRGLA